MTQSMHQSLVKSERFIGHVALVVIGLALMVVGLALGVTMVLLPVGLVVGLAGVLLLISGLFAREGDATPPGSQL